MSSQGIKLVFGGAMIGRVPVFKDQAGVDALMDVLEKYNCMTIDSAQSYGDSEKVIGETGVAKRGFIIDTKWIGGWQPGFSTKENIIQTARDSIKTLNVSKVDIFYMHAPDTEVPIEETCAGVNDVYKEGLFERFGLSNYTASDVEKVYDCCKTNGYVLPTVYQGNYSPVARKQETILFPTLRKLGIGFYAYSPLAGGFLVKTKQDIVEKKGRFDPDTLTGKMYSTLYCKPSFLEALSEWEAISEEEGCSKADLAYRWVTYNSPLKKEHGDAIIIGASKLEQAEQTLIGLKAGPLSESAVKKIDHIWSTIEHEAGVDNYSL